jgi:hypothetical protein
MGTSTSKDTSHPSLTVDIQTLYHHRLTSLSPLGTSNTGGSKGEGLRKLLSHLVEIIAVLVTRITQMQSFELFSELRRLGCRGQNSH